MTGLKEDFRKVMGGLRQISEEELAMRENLAELKKMAAELRENGSK